MNSPSTLADNQTVMVSNRSHTGQKKKWRRLKQQKKKPTQFEKKLVDIKSLGLKGATEDLDGWVITLPGECKNLRQDQFREIIDNIGNYACKKVHYPEDITCFFEDFERKEVKKPEDPEEEQDKEGNTIPPSATDVAEAEV